MKSGRKRDRQIDRQSEENKDPTMKDIVKSLKEFPPFSQEETEITKSRSLFHISFSLSLSLVLETTTKQY